MHQNRIILTVLSLGAFALLAAGTGDNSTSERISTAPASRSNGSSQTAAPMPMPGDEQAFCQAALQAAQGYEAMQGDGANQLKLSRLKTSRAAALKAALPSRVADDWVGNISALKTTSDGQGVLAVKLPCGINVKTWNNAFSDSGDGTLISQKSALFEALADLKEGLPIHFSGTFFADRAKGLKESSLTEAGSMKEPEFIMKFSAAAKR